MRVLTYGLSKIKWIDDLRIKLLLRCLGVLPSANSSATSIYNKLIMIYFELAMEDEVDERKEGVAFSRKIDHKDEAEVSNSDEEGIAAKQSTNQISNFKDLIEERVCL
jgi:hypothetical protein